MRDLPPVWRRPDILTTGVTDSELRVLLRRGDLIRVGPGG
jgi:hypothetical protein